jgi:hypothetical protein
VAQAETAPGRVHWLLSTAARTEESAAALEQLRSSSWPDAIVLWPEPGDTLDLDGATLRVLQPTPADDGTTARQFLLHEERFLFTGTGMPAVHTGDEIEWIAPAGGFIVRQIG